MPAPRAPPASDDDHNEFYGEVDNHAYLSPPQFVSREAAAGLATIAAVGMAGARIDRLAMIFKGFQD